MKLKVDDQGHAILADGKPVYIMDDNSERPFDVPELFGSIKRVSDERQSARDALDAAKQQLSAYEGLDAKAAREALTRLQKLDDKKLIDAGEVDKLRTQIEEQYQAKLQAANDQLTTKDQTIRHMLVESAIVGSSWLGEHAVVKGSAAVKLFGDHFAVEYADNGSPRVVAKLNEQPVMSPANPAQYASVDEALQVIIGAHPQANELLRAGKPGGGAIPGPKGGTPGQSKRWSQMSSGEQSQYVESHGLDSAKALMQADATP